MWDWGRGAKQLVVQETLLRLSYLSYLWFTPITNTGGGGGAEVPVEAPPFKWALFSMVVQKPVDPTTHLAFGVASLLEDGAGLPINVRLPILNWTARGFAVARIVLERVHHVFVVNEGVIDGNNIHFASSGRQP